MSGLRPFKKGDDEAPLVDLSEEEERSQTDHEVSRPVPPPPQGLGADGDAAPLYKPESQPRNFFLAPGDHDQLRPVAPALSDQRSPPTEAWQGPPPSPGGQLLPSPGGPLLPSPAASPAASPGSPSRGSEDHSESTPEKDSLRGVGVGAKSEAEKQPSVVESERPRRTRDSEQDNTPTTTPNPSSAHNLPSSTHHHHHHPPSPSSLPAVPPDSVTSALQSSSSTASDDTDSSTSSSTTTTTTTADTVRLLPHSATTSGSYQTFLASPHMETNGKTTDGWSPYTSQTDMIQNGGGGSSRPVGPQGNRTFVYILACFATIGGLLFGYDTGIVSGSMLLIQPYFDLSIVWQETIVSGTIGAAAVFALIAGPTCDWMGRKKVIMIASFIFAGGAVVMAISPNKEVLLGGRIIVGVGIGFASMTVPVYVSESAPPDIRGRLVTLNQLFITIGILLSSVLAGAFSTMKETGWRYMLGLAGVPGAIQFIGFIFLPESPRWLVSKGRDEEAKEVLRKIRGHNDIDEEFKEVKDAEANKQTGFAFFQIMKTPHVRKALFVGCGLQLFQQLCGINTVIYYSATILKMAGFPPEQAIWLVCVPFGVNFLATFIGVWAVERLGRKILLCVSFVGVTIALLVLAVGFLLSAKHSPPVNGTLPVLYSNGSLVSDECQKYSVCEDCILNAGCGYCYDNNQSGAATCLLAKVKDEDLYADYGRCDQNATGAPAGSDMRWTHGYCPTDYTWMAVLGLALFVLSFAPGLGPMPWTINSEIYPMWARGTGNAIATMFNWAFNLAVSFSFLTLLETITKYGTFFLFMGICVLGLAFTLIFVPETRNMSLEEVEELFMDPVTRDRRRKERLAGREIVIEDPRDFSSIDTKM